MMKIEGGESIRGMYNKSFSNIAKIILEYAPESGFTRKQEKKLKKIIQKDISDNKISQQEQEILHTLIDIMKGS
jgi:hypothetical protein